MSGTSPALARPLTPTRLRFSSGVWGTLFVVSLLLYALTASRGVQWQDSGAHILRVVTGQVYNPLGLALAHPLHHWLARGVVALDLFEPSFAVTLVSALAGALGIANVYGAVVTLTDRHLAALFAAVSLAVAHTFWQLSTLAETYTLCAALLAGELWCMAAFLRTSRNGWLYGMALFNGLGIANHMLASLTTPIILIVAVTRLIQRRRPGRPALLAGGLWVLGTLPYTWLIVQTWWSTGDLGGTIHSALFGEYAGDVLNAAPSSRQFLIALAFPVYNFPNLLLPAAVYGMFRSRIAGVPRATARALLAGFVIHLLFVMRYSIVDQHLFFLPMYVYVALYGGIGAAVVMKWTNDALRMRVVVIAVLLLLLTPVVYAFAPALARRAGVLERTVGLRHKPYRDDYRYLLTPWSVAENSAERLSTQAMAMAGERGVILYQDPMVRFALEYKLNRHAPEDTVLVHVPRGMDAEQRARFDEMIRLAVETERPVVLVPLSTDEPMPEPPVGEWEREGQLYRLGAGAPAE